VKVAPSPRAGVLVLLAYLVVFYGIWAVNGIDYPHVADNADTIMKWYVMPLVGGAVVLVIAATILGWWRPAVLEKEKASPPWLLASPLLMLAIAVFILLGKDFASTTTSMFVLLIIGSLLVGFDEELATRGLLVVGLRGAYAESRVWLLSTLAFALIHLPNWVFGAGSGAVMQVVLAFLSGTVLYLLRRVAGSLVWAMLLHGFWDFASFAGTGSSPITLGLLVVNGVVGLALVRVLLRREHGARVRQLAPA
jgi:hypothetical protein